MALSRSVDCETIDRLEFWIDIVIRYLCTYRGTQEPVIVSVKYDDSRWLVPNWHSKGNEVMSASLIIISYKLTMCQLLYHTNTYKHRVILLTIPYIRVGHPCLTQPYPGTTCFLFKIGSQIKLDFVKKKFKSSIIEAIGHLGRGNIFLRIKKKLCSFWGSGSERQNQSAEK